MRDTTWEDSIATRMGRVLTPVRPSLAFRDRLRTGLQEASRDRVSRRVPSRSRPFAVWMVGAAALGVSLAAGSFIAWRVRSRLTHSPPRRA